MSSPEQQEQLPARQLGVLPPLTCRQNRMKEPAMNKPSRFRETEIRLIDCAKEQGLNLPLITSKR